MALSDSPKPAPIAPSIVSNEQFKQLVGLLQRVGIKLPEGTTPKNFLTVLAITLEVLAEHNSGPKAPRPAPAAQPLKKTDQEVDDVGHRVVTMSLGGSLGPNLCTTPKGTFEINARTGEMGRQVCGPIVPSKQKSKTGWPVTMSLPAPSITRTHREMTPEQADAVVDRELARIGHMLPEPSGRATPRPKKQDTTDALLAAEYQRIGKPLPELAK